MTSSLAPRAVSNRYTQRSSISFGISFGMMEAKSKFESPRFMSFILEEFESFDEMKRGVRALWDEIGGGGGGRWMFDG